MKRNLEEQKQGSSMNEAIPLFYTREQYERAVERAKSHPDRSTDPQSITRGHGLITGCLGEIIVEDYLEHIAQTDDDEAREVKEKLQYDILLKDGTTLEVKSKGHSVLTCPNFYDCSVSAINSRQRADYYVFVRIHGRKLRDCYGFDHSNSRKAWICGMAEKEVMVKPERLMKRGTVIRNSSYFDFKAKSNCYQIKIRELEALPRDLGKKIDLCASGQIVWKAEDLPKFLESDEEEYFCSYDKCWQGGYFAGLASLDTKDREHFEKYVDVYVFYTAMQNSDTTELEAAKANGWKLKRLVMRD
jgi:hypothetical protein